MRLLHVGNLLPSFRLQHRVGHVVSQRFLRLFGGLGTFCCNNELAMGPVVIESDVGGILLQTLPEFDHTDEIQHQRRGFHRSLSLAFFSFLTILIR